MTILNSADKHADITLSNGNLSAQKNAGGAWRGVRGTRAIPGGAKKYFEFTVNAIPTGADTAAVGLATSGASLSGASVTNLTNSYIYVIETGADAGQVINNGSAAATYDDVPDQNSYLMIAYDEAAGNLWFGLDGTWFNSGDPAAGTNALITGLSGTLYPIVFMYDDGLVGTVAFSEDDIQGTVPTGFEAMDPVEEKTFESTGAMTGTMTHNYILQPQITLGSGVMTGSMARSTVLSPSLTLGTGEMAGSMAPTGTVKQAEFSSTGALNGTMSAIATILAEFSSTAHMMNFFSQASEEFDVWAVTLDPGPDGIKRYAAYPFTNYNFNSFASLDGLTFAAGDGGTYVLGDFDDDGMQIDAYVQTGKSNVGTDRDKRIRVAYVVGTCEAPPLLDVEDGSGNTYTFEGRTNAPDEPQRIKVQLARGMKGGMWGWKIKNQDGSDFDFSDLMALPEPLSRRVD